MEAEQHTYSGSPPGDLCLRSSYQIGGDPTPYIRKGFIFHIRNYDWEDNVVLRHENTIPKAVNDRVELLEKTELHSSPTHGLYTDPGFHPERYMDEAMM